MTYYLYLWRTAAIAVFSLAIALLMFLFVTVGCASFVTWSLTPLLQLIEAFTLNIFWTIIRVCVAIWIIIGLLGSFVIWAQWNDDRS